MARAKVSSIVPLQARDFEQSFVDCPSWPFCKNFMSTVLRFSTNLREVVIRNLHIDLQIVMF